MGRDSSSGVVCSPAMCWSSAPGYSLLPCACELSVPCGAEQKHLAPAVLTSLCQNDSHGSLQMRLAKVSQQKSGCRMAQMMTMHSCCKISAGCTGHAYTVPLAARVGWCAAWLQTDCGSSGAFCCYSRAGVLGEHREYPQSWPLGRWMGSGHDALGLHWGFSFTLLI